MIRIDMTEMIRLLLLDSSPNWLVAVLAALLALQFWRVSRLERQVRRHARSIAHMDAWADVMDERMERVDWIKMHQTAANDRRRKVRKAG